MSKLNKLLLTVSVFVLFVSLFTAAAYAEPTKSGIITGDAVNVRENPSTTANILTQLSVNAQVIILEGADGWYKVSFGDTTGWVSSQYVSPRDIVTGRVTGNDVNLRKGPSTSAGVIATLDAGTAVSILGRSGEWYKVKTGEGSIGWVNNQFVAPGSGSVSRGSVETAIPEIVVTEDGSTQQQLVNFAMKQLGVGYVWGGTTPKGFDCSGFVSYVFSNFGVTLERVAASQAGQGTKVAKANLQLADLVFFDTNGGHGYINHVGIYIGNGQFIHASSGSGRVTVSNLSDGFYGNTYMTARRILN